MQYAFKPSLAGSRLGPAILVFSLLLLFQVAAQAGGKDTASSLLRKLPTTIFDNTSLPLSEDDKEQLLDKGYAGAWVVVKANPDFLAMSLPDSLDGEVMVRLFRNGDSRLVVLGATTESTCAAELWSISPKGGLTPEHGPEAPPSSDFFRSGISLPTDISMTTRLCFDGETLEIKPLFWNKKGPVHLNVHFRVLCHWDGTNFTRKEIIPIETKPTGEARKTP